MKYLLLLLSLIILSCTDNRSIPKTVSHKAPPMEISDFYNAPAVHSIYSQSVKDSFEISVTLPEKYRSESTSKFPLILVLDANAYLEPISSEIKLGTLTQGYPPSIIVGIGYKGFWAMDSLRNRDYTYPVAPAADSFKLSGGGLNFKRFINEELLPNIKTQVRVDSSKIILLGHSLGGYFVLYYFLDAISNGETSITNFIAASPSLWYSNGHLFKEKKSLHPSNSNMPFKLFVSIGSLEKDPGVKIDDFERLKSEFHTMDTIVKSRFVELGNFSHMEAAIPGFMKGLSFTLVE